MDKLKHPWLVARWVKAVDVTRPEVMARSFALDVGQFYVEGEFTAMARRVYALYARRDPADADTFRHELDRRLDGKYREPLDWGPPTRRART
jgi:hypothetical protein